MPTVKIKRIYEPPAAGDGYRILVDRLWPRGVKKATADIDLWLKEIAPSSALRTWFAHDPAKWATFRKKYMSELKDNPAVKELTGHIRQHTTVTLLYGAKDEAHNQAVVLQQYMQSLIK